MLGGIGPPELLIAGEAPEPERGPDDVLVEVRAAGINFSDLLIRRGEYPHPPELPAVLGSEVAGVVIAAPVGSGLARGRPVVALPLAGGGYAERVAVPRQLVFAAPEGLDFRLGAALPMTHLTALIAIDSLLRLGSGERLLVHAGGGGVGSAALSIAAIRGLGTIATASSPARLELARRLGAEVVVDRRSQDFAGAAMEWTGGEGVDGAIDPLGGEILESTLPVIRALGSLVAVGEAAGPWGEIPINRLVGRNIGVQGLYLGRLARFAPERLREAGERLMGLVAVDGLEPAVGATFALEDAPAAHRLIEDGGHAGKVVLEL
jgi:NADPH:quinone reductase